MKGVNCCLTGAFGVPEKILPCKTRSCTSTVSSVFIGAAKPNDTVDHLIPEIRKIIKVKRNDIETVFRNVDIQNTGRVLKSEMKQIMRVNCFPLTVEQFDCLLKYCHEDEVGNVFYQEFIDKMCGCPRPLEAVAHRPSSNFTLDELEALLKDQMHKNLKNVVRGFIGYDYAKDGYIQKEELRKVIENCCFKMSDEQFECLWRRHDLMNFGWISYEDFLMEVGIHAGACKKFIPKYGYKRPLQEEKHIKAKEIIESTRRPLIESRDDPAIKSMKLKEIEAKFVKRLQVQEMGMMLRNAFQKHDTLNTGFIYQEDFHGVLNQFVMPMSQGVFTQLMNRCFPASCFSKVYSYDEFLRKFCYTPKPLEPEFVDHPFCAPTVPMTKRVKATLRRIERTTSEAKNRLAQTFILMDYRGAKVFTRMELRRNLERTGIYLPEENLRELYEFLDPLNTNTITIHNFLDAFEHKAEPAYIKEEFMIPSRGKGYPNVHEQPLKRRLRSYFNRSFPEIHKEVLDADPTRTFKIHHNTLRHIIEKFCFYFTDEQWAELLDDFILVNDLIYYDIFFKAFKKGCYEETDRWVKDVGKLLCKKYRNLMTLEHREIVRHVKDFVRSKGAYFLKDCMDIDLGAKFGTIGKPDFRRLVDKHIMRLNTPQFEDLWLEVPKSMDGQMVYAHFLQNFGYI